MKGLTQSARSSMRVRYSNTKILNIQALRGIAVLLVMALHVASNEEKYSHGYGILPDWVALGASGVDIFFVISGFVMVTTTRGKFQNKGSIPRFLYHRVTRIYPAYWLYSLLMLMVFWLQQREGATRAVDLTASFLLLPQNQLPLLVVGWTLVHEMYFYLVFSLLLLFSERWLPGLLFSWGIAAIAAGWHFSSSTSPMIQLIVNPLTLEFIIGGLIALLHRPKNPVSSWSCVLMAVAWWVVGYGACARLGVAPESSVWLRVCLYGIPAALSVYGLVAMEQETGRKLPAWLVAIGDASFSLYLSHLLIIATVGRLWETLGVVGPWMNASVLIAMLVSALAVGIASFRFIERPLLTFTRRFEAAVVWAFDNRST